MTSARLQKECIYMETGFERYELVQEDAQDGLVAAVAVAVRPRAAKVARLIAAADFEAVRTPGPYALVARAAPRPWLDDAREEQRRGPPHTHAATDEAHAGVGCQGPAAAELFFSARSKV